MSRPRGPRSARPTTLAWDPALALKAEIPLTTVRDSLGHASLSTSGIYMHEDLIERKRQMERLFGDPAANPKSTSSAPAP